MSPVSQNDFQQLVRDLADPDVTDLDPADEAHRHLARRYQEIRAKLAMANVRLVAHVARRYHDRGIPSRRPDPGGLLCPVGGHRPFRPGQRFTVGDLCDLVDSPGNSASSRGGGLSGPVKPEAAPSTGAGPGKVRRGGDDTGRMTRSDLPQRALSPTIEQVFAATRPVLSLDAPSRFDAATTIGEFLVPPDDEDSKADDAQHSVGDLIKTLGPREQTDPQAPFRSRGRVAADPDRGEQGARGVEGTRTSDPEPGT